MPYQSRSLITADLHLSDNPRDSYRLHIFKTLRALANKHEADELIILGDLTERKDRHPAGLVNTIVDELARTSKRLPITILRGNHDGMTSDNPFFRFVKHLDNVTWINEPTFYPDGRLFLPHTTNYKRDWIIDEINDACVIFAHNTFEGAHGDAGFELKGIPTKMFPRDARVVSGDVHKPQTINCEAKGATITYVGAPYRVDFGDEYDPRVILLTNNKATQSIPVPGPQKRLLTFTGPIDATAATDKFMSCFINPGDILKVRVHIRAADIANWSQIRAKVRLWGVQRGYVIHVVQPIVARDTGKHTKASKLIPSKSDEQLMREYVKKHKLDDRTLDVGLDLIEGTQ